MKLYKFKKVKHSVVMKLVNEENGVLKLVNRDYDGLYYYAKMEDLEELSEDE